MIWLYWWGKNSNLFIKQLFCKWIVSDEINAYEWHKNQHQQSYLLSFKISCLIGFCNQWALLYLSCDFLILFWMKVQYMIQDMLKHFFAKWSNVVLVCRIPAPILFAMKQRKWDSLFSFNNISLLVVISFNNYNNDYNLIMMTVTLIVNFHFKYKSDVLFACAGMYNKFQ